MKNINSIAFLTQPFSRFVPPAEGGSVNIWTYQVARRLRPFCRITIYSRGNKLFILEKKEFEGIEFIYFPRFPLHLLARISSFKTRLIRIFNKPTPGRPDFAAGYGQTYAAYAAKHLKYCGTEYVIVANFSQFVPVLKRHCPKIKIILHMHCSWLSQLDPDWIKPRLKLCYRIIGCSNFIRDQITASFPGLKPCVFTVYNGVNLPPSTSKPKRKAHPAGRFRFLFVGRISPEKGLHHLLLAMVSLAPRYPQARLSIAGGEGMVPREYLVDLCQEQYVKELACFYKGTSYLAYLRSLVPGDVMKRIDFLGTIPYSKLGNLYRNSDILVNPSLSESFGMSLAEAMSFGLPVIATRVGGMTELVDEGSDGVLVPPADVKGLSEAMEYFLKASLNAPSLLLSMGETAFKKAQKRFSWEKIAQDFCAVLGVNGPQGEDRQTNETGMGVM